VFGQLSDDVLLTLAAIKVLHEYFKKDLKLWNLVERKARKFILTQGIEKE